MQDIINICVVNFHATCMDKESNINRIYGFIRAAAKRGADLVLFPEMCVNGYDFYDCKTNRFYNTPESVDGEFAHNILELAKKHEIIIVLGMAEEDDKTSKIYNSALVVSPQGIHGCYRKIHPFGDENLWCSKGEMPFMLESEFGKIGIGICYDTYQFPELIRYYTHKGMRLYLNPTALIYEVSKSHYEDAFLDYYLKTLGYAVMCNSIFVASANLVGRDRENFFAGGSCVLGVKTTPFLHAINIITSWNRLQYPEFRL